MIVPVPMIVCVAMIARVPMIVPVPMIVRMRVLMRGRGRVRLSVDDDMHLRADERPALHALALEPEAGDRQLRQCRAHDVLRHAEIEQRTQRHVARDAGEAVEVQLAPAQLSHDEAPCGS
jgi:hypothetical protein